MKFGDFRRNFGQFKRGINPLKQAAAGDADEFLRKRQRIRIGPREKGRARAVLMRVPETRKADAVKELVAWTYCADIFHGLSDKQRRQICLEARGEAVEESGTLISVGQDAPGIKVIMEGECAIYTMRKMDLGTSGNQSSREGPAAALRDKFQQLQRRTSLAVRRESSVVNQMGQLQHVPTVAGQTFPRFFPFFSPILSPFFPRLLDRAASIRRGCDESGR